MSGNNKPLIILIGILIVALIGLGIVAVSMGDDLPQTAHDAHPTVETEPTLVTTEAPTEPTTEPTEPPITKVATATVGATGDMLPHELVYKSGYNSATGEYDYNYAFEHFRQCVSCVDYAVANLETTLCGNENGYAYSGYPCFNCPDAMAQALKNAGFDMLLTANNHSYDTKATGFSRTQEVVAQVGLPHIGTRPSLEHKNYAVVDVNGIRLGMINYTYNTGVKTNGAVSLNGIPLSVENSQLINTFHYDRLDEFYEKLSGEMDDMYAEGAEAIVLYIHWGDEYRTTENATQRKMAQQLCNLGIDVIVGNHAHVPQPVVLLTNEEDETQKTLCLYSTGNALSNLYQTAKHPVNTEDGMLFTFTFAKYSDGTVLVESTRIIPTWVHRYDEGGVRKFQILYMDDTVEDWQDLMGLSNSVLSKCQDAYDRTMGIVGDGIQEANEYYSAHQAEVESLLGVKL